MHHSGPCSRRRFLQAGAAGAAALLASRDAQGQGVAQAVWRPCVDVGGQVSEIEDRFLTRADGAPPVRLSVDDLLAPVDIALIEAARAAEQGELSQALTGQAAVPSSAVGQALASPRVVQAMGLPGDSVPARMAARSRWPSGSKLKVYFYADGHSAALRTRVLRIANKWQDEGGANVSFTDTPNRAESQIRLAFQNTGHWSYVGLDNNSVRGQTMNLEMRDGPSDTEYNHGVVLHEFGHALGCIHEHQSPSAEGFFNAAEVYRYFASRYGWDRAKVDLNVLGRYNTSQLLRGFISSFDRDSVMLYSYPAELTSNNVGTKVNVTLSEIDKRYIRLLYPNGSANGPDTTTEPTTTRGRLVVDGDPVEGRLTATTTSNEFEFEITEAGSHTLRTHGSTIVWLDLYSGTSPVDLSDKRMTPDLINQRVHLQLAKGKYRVAVRHRETGGGGQYLLQLLKGDHVGRSIKILTP